MLVKRVRIEGASPSMGSGDGFASVMLLQRAKSCAQASLFYQNPCRSIGLSPVLS
jgi:hypothetical protein